MPDILIRMEMPGHCFNCSTKINPDERRCNIDGHVFEETLSKLTSRRDDDCPLVELPPHGDLISRSDAIIDVNERGYDFWNCDTDIDSAVLFLNEQTVIVPASEEGG